MAPLRVLLADDHGVLRLGIATLLVKELACEICAECGEGREALKLAESTRPDVAVIDVGIPGLNGLEVARQIRRVSPDTEVVILSGDDSSEMAAQALATGAKAFVAKVRAALHLAEAVQAAAEHRFFLTPEAHASLHLNGPSWQPAPRALTDREREVIQLVAEGQSNKQVADRLGISAKTVETHRSTIMRNLKLAGLSDLVRYAIREKIIVP